ncbi:tetraspanin-33-like isoform X1 [Bolinopsis microptera]|uniref:tetraspanin-33-like isoform X1 n=1 Tax=Bolinopsis microptera TaxID=2820187 RepID=UPI00307A5DE3
MGVGTGLMKTLMFVFNGIVWVLGLVLFVVGIVVLVEGKNWNEIVDNKTVPVSVMLIVVGLIIAVVGFLGCFGAMKQSGNMLLAYSVILGLIIILQCVAGILAFIFSDEAIKASHSGFVTAVANYDPRDDSTTGGIDWLQKHLDCCGIQNASDWRENAQKATIWIKTYFNSVPDSCCKRLRDQWNPTPKCGEEQGMGNSPLIHNGGCYEKMVAWIYTYMPMMGVMALAFILFEAVVILITCVLRRDGLSPVPVRIQ